jgi:drug/metabolite transporter (DMT)-like permease
LGIILGITAAVCWGGADFLARYGTRRIGAYCTLFYMQFFGLAGLGAYLLMAGPSWPGSRPGGEAWHAWLWAIAAGLLNAAGSLALYRAFEVGILALVGPIAASYPALTVVLDILTGEKLGAARAIGVGMALIGVILAAIPPSTQTPESSSLVNSTQTSQPRSRLAGGVGWAIAAAVSFGLMFWLIGLRVTPVLGGILPVWLFRLTTVAVLLTLALPARQDLRVPRGGGIWWLLAGTGILDTCAFVATNLGLTTEQVSVVTVLSSLFGVVTVALAWAVLRERLSRWQWCGIALIFLAIALISA